MEIETILTEYAEMYRSPLGAEQLVLYLDALDGCTATEVRASMRQLARDAKWMPRPAEILEVIRSARAEANRRNNTTALSASAAKPSRSKWRVPAGVSIMEHIEHLRSDGLNADQIAEQLCGPEDAATERRYSCHHCQDTGYTRIWHPESMRQAYHGHDIVHRACTVPCDCNRGKTFAEAGRRWQYHYHADRMVRVTGDWQTDEVILREHCARAFNHRKHQAFVGYES